MSGSVVSRDVAESDFVRICKFGRVDSEPEDKKEREDVGESRAKIVPLIVSGVVTVADDGAPTVETSAGGYTFRKPDVRALMVTDDEDGNVGKLVAFISELTGADEGDFASVELADFRALKAIGELFFGVL